MARDTSIEQAIETTLHTAGVHESGALASAIVEQLVDDMKDDPEKWIIAINKIAQGYEVIL